MCGIAGFVDVARSASDEAAVLRRMLDKIAQRGPDDAGTLIDGSVALGHRRLSILDLSELGHQPMRSRTGRFIITFNGEIYNHLRLRSELEATGSRFTGHSDTEVLLELIEAVGLQAALRRCIGMFAIAVWDRDTRTLQLARDRFGEKPLYYGSNGKVFLFGSELKALAAHDAFSRRVDAASVQDLLRLGYIPGPHTVYLHAKKLPPGHVLTLRLPAGATAAVGADDWDMRIDSYWTHQAVVLDGLTSPFRGSFEDALIELEGLVSDAVDLQMQADVPLGAFLSGGVDSSLVVAHMQRLSSRPIQTYTVGFADVEFNEAGFAKAVAEHLGTRHQELYVSSADALDVVPALSKMFDEPLADPSQIPMHLVARLARHDVTVALSGDGGDELFGGYPRYSLGRNITKVRWRGALSFILQMVLWSRIHGIARILPTSIRGRVSDNRLETIARLLRAESFARLAEAASEINCESDALMQTPARRESSFSRCRPEGLESAYIPTAMLLDRETYLPDDVLVKVDRATMAVSLESRAPLLDHRIAEFAARLPIEFLVNGTEAKRILRAALYRQVPRDLVERPKAGFSIPLAKWLREDLKEWACDLLTSRKLADIVHMERCRALFESHLCGQRDLSMACWAVLSALSWAEAWL